MKKKTILVVTHVFATFVKRDVEILNKKYLVKQHAYSGGKDLLSNFFGQIKLFFWLILHIWSAHAVYVWFADYHAFLPVLFAKICGKRSFVIEGGYDTVALPEYKYGSHVNPLRSKMSTFAMRYAELNLPVSKALGKEVIERIPTARIEHLYTGLDEKIFFPSGEKQKTILTIAGRLSSQRIKIKGVDRFVEVAKKMPEMSFIIVGAGDGVKTELHPLPPNVTITGKLSQKDLMTYFHQAMIYAQFSVREGLPTAVLEAMLCECVPIGFDTGGIPEAIGDAGIIINDKSTENIIEAIGQGIKEQKILGPKARLRVIKNFPESLREKRLFEILEQEK